MTNGEDSSLLEITKRRVQNGVSNKIDRRVSNDVVEQGAAARYLDYELLTHH